MPCTYYESPEEIAEAAKKARDRRHKELDRVTALLCGVMTVLENADALSPIETSRSLNAIPGLRSWWKAHKKRDGEKKL